MPETDQEKADREKWTRKTANLIRDYNNANDPEEKESCLEELSSDLYYIQILVENSTF